MCDDAVVINIIMVFDLFCSVAVTILNTVMVSLSSTTRNKNSKR